MASAGVVWAPMLAAGVLLEPPLSVAEGKVAGSAGDASVNQGQALSADGRFVTFTSFATNLVEDDTNGQRDVFVWDRTNDRVEIVSRGAGGQQSNGCLLYTSPSPRDKRQSRMPSSA